MEKVSKIELKLLAPFLKKQFPKDWKPGKQRGSRKKSTYPNWSVYREIGKLRCGEGLVIEEKDWHTKTPPPQAVGATVHSISAREPNTICGKTFFGKKFRIRTLKDNEGWVVKRMV